MKKGSGGGGGAAAEKKKARHASNSDTPPRVSFTFYNGPFIFSFFIVY